jgi:hypothetical protein
MENISSIQCKNMLSAVTHKLNISGQMVIWPIFLVLMCGTSAQSLSAPFSYILYTWLMQNVHFLGFHSDSKHQKAQAEKSEEHLLIKTLKTALFLLTKYPCIKKKKKRNQYL